MVLTSITAKPYILQKTLFNSICSKFYRVKHGHDFFLAPLTSWRLLEAKNTPRRPKKVQRNWFTETSIKLKLLNELITPKWAQSDLTYKLREKIYEFWGHRPLNLEL